MIRHNPAIVCLYVSSEEEHGTGARVRNVRRSYARDKLRQQMKRQGLPCHLCGQPIDYSLPAGHPWSFEMDELVPVSRLPMEQRKAAACDPSNVAPAHRCCNQRKSNKLIGSLDPKDAPNVDKAKRTRSRTSKTIVSTRAW